MSSYVSRYNAYVDQLVADGRGSAYEGELFKAEFAKKAPGAQQRMLRELNLDASQQGTSPAEQARTTASLASATPEQTRALGAMLGLGTNAGSIGVDPYKSAQNMVAGAQQYAQNEATDARFGHDMAWLDPTFVETPALLGRSAGSQVYADPRYVGAQESALAGFQSLGSTPLNFESSARQEGMFDQWGGIASGAGAPVFMGNGQQQAILNQIAGLGMPEWVSDDAQQDVLSRYNARIEGEGAPEFDKSGRQEDQYANLEEIINGGGATEIEMARRQAQRADQEQWLRSQREATQQEYAERGLTGSGSELLTLAEDRQAAAGRNSLADLQTAADLELRRDRAIGSAADLATAMRTGTFQEQSYLDSALLQALSGAGNMANALRDAGYREEAFDAGYSLDKLNSQGNLATNMRGQTFQELSYNDQRKITAMLAQTDLANALRRDQYTESIGQRDADLRALSGYAGMATDLRNAGVQEAQYRAESTDLFTRLNAESLNAANSGNIQYLRDSYTNMINGRRNEGIVDKQIGAEVARSLYNTDVEENQYGYGQSAELAGSDANAYNRAQSAYNSNAAAAYAGGTGRVWNAQDMLDQNIMQQFPQFAGSFVETAATSGAGYPGAGTGTTAQVPKWDPSKERYSY